MILFEEIGGVGKIILNRPDKFHSVVRELALELQKVLDYCEKSNNIRRKLLW